MVVRVCLYIWLLCLPVVVASQNYSVQISADTNSISIGEQAKISITYNISQHSQYQHPIYGEELVKNVIFCSSPQFDTVAIEKDSFNITCTYCITSFTPGEYSFQIGPILYNQKDTLWSPSIQLSVTAVDVDLQADIRDIAPIHESKYSWYERNKVWILMFIGIIILLAIAFGVWWYVTKIRKKTIDTLDTELPNELAHIRALRLLEEIQNKELCMQQLHKQYYTEITDVLREYYQTTLGIPIFERTSDEIIRDISRTGKVSIAVIQNLKLLLHQADLVKFAKYIPHIEQTEIHFGLAIFCVNESIPNKQEPEVW